MQRVAVLLLLLAACSPAVTLDPLPSNTEESALFVSGTAPPNAHVEIRGGASKVITQANAEGHFQTYVALAADRENTLSAHPEGTVAQLTEANRKIVLHHSRDVSGFLAQSKDAPALTLTGDAQVDGLIATVRGRTTPRAAVRISGGARELATAASIDGSFELSVVLKQQLDNALTVVATSKAGIDSAALTVRVSPVMNAALPPIPAIDPSLAKSASRVGYTIRGNSAPGMGVQVETAGAVVAKGFADATGAFALGVELTPSKTSTFLVKSVNHAGATSAASTVAIAWAGPAPTSKYPIVLVHGMGGFDSILGYDYFYGIEDRLTALGFQVYVASLTPLAKPAQRAQELKQQIQALTSGKVNIIAHSQGTIDSRYMITHLGMANQVASYTSIAGPHRGSKVADVALQLIPGPVSKAVDFWLAQLGLDWGAVAALSESEMAKFNALTPDSPNVYYQSYTGIADPFGIKTGVPISAYLVAPWLILEAVDGNASDGLVTVPSSKWGNFKGTLSADHITEVGQVFGLVFTFDYRQFYEDTALDLVARGF